MVVLLVECLLRMWEAVGLNCQPGSDQDWKMGRLFFPQELSFNRLPSATEGMVHHEGM